MRKALFVALVLAGVLTAAFAAPRGHIATKAAFHNHVMVDGLYVALPTEMHNFPVELVAEP
jgi:hypothetical protein